MLSALSSLEKHLLNLKASGQEHHQFPMAVYALCLALLVPSHLFEFACLGISKSFSKDGYNQGMKI